MMEKNTYRYQGFKLIDLHVFDNKVLGNNKFNFIDSNDDQNSIYTSVIIGSNGTGKSELLSLIIQLFRNMCLTSFNQRLNSIDGKYLLTFSKDGDIYSYSNFENDNQHLDSDASPFTKVKPYIIRERGNKIIVEEEFISLLPSTIVANSIMITDKFIVPRNQKEIDLFPMYKYLGIRNRPQQASTRSYVRKTVEFIVEQRNSIAFKNGLKKITEFLGIEKSIHVLFYTTYTTKFFTGTITKYELETFFHEIDSKYQEIDTQAPYKLNYYNSLISKDDEIIEELIVFMNRLVLDGRLEHIPKSSVKILRYDIVDDNSHTDLKSEYHYLEHLRMLGIISAAEVSLNNGKIDIQNSSSGEFHFFSTMVGLMATIKPNSLILIDEPEISLHPNWQMQYLSFVRNLFSDAEYKTCQIIIATHSHFLISDLKGESAHIIGLKKDDSNLDIVSFPKNVNTYGWSAEEVLYRIFNVRTTRNHYLEMDLRKMLHLVSRGLNSDVSEGPSDRNEVKIILERVKKIQLNEHDPLKEIISQVENYLEI